MLFAVIIAGLVQSCLTDKFQDWCEAKTTQTAFLHNSCYEFQPTVMYIDAARDKCVADGGFLALVDSPEKEQLMIGMNLPSTYIGLSDQDAGAAPTEGWHWEIPGVYKWPSNATWINWSADVEVGYSESNAEMHPGFAFALINDLNGMLHQRAILCEYRAIPGNSFKPSEEFNQRSTQGYYNELQLAVVATHTMDDIAEYKCANACTDHIACKAFSVDMSNGLCYLHANKVAAPPDVTPSNTHHSWAAIHLE